MTTFLGNDLGSSGIDPPPRHAVTPTVSAHLRTSGPWRIVVVEGEMDIQAVPLLPDLRGVALRVVFDLRGVTFMDAGALGALVAEQRRVSHAGGCLRLVAQAGPVLSILSRTGTSNLFCTFDTLGRALRTPFVTRLRVRSI
jgi:anti-anti-sigma factor